MTAPHVLMTSDAVGGVLTYSLELGRGLSAAGWRVSLALQGPDVGEAEGLAASAGLEPIRVSWPLDWLARDPNQLLAAGADCARLADRLRVDLVHLNAPALAAGGAFSSPVIGACHSCLRTWWSAVKEGEPPPEFLWRTKLLARGYGACDVLIAPSFSFVQDTLAHYGQLPRGVRNGLRPGKRRTAFGRKRPVVVTTGRLWDEGKNVQDLDRAAAIMRGEVWAVGPLQGPNGQAAALSAARALGRLDSEGVDEVLNGALVFASLARYEPFGLGVLEAAQAGCALVLSDIPTFRELWDGAAVFVSTAADPERIADVLDGLLDRPEEAHALGRLALERSKTYSAEALTRRTLDAYAAALAASPAEVAA